MVSFVSLPHPSAHLISSILSHHILIAFHSSQLHLSCLHILSIDPLTLCEAPFSFATPSTTHSDVLRDEHENALIEMPLVYALRADAETYSTAKMYCATSSSISSLLPSTFAFPSSALAPSDASKTSMIVQSDDCVNDSPSETRTSTPLVPILDDSDGEHEFYPPFPLALNTRGSSSLFLPASSITTSTNISIRPGNLVRDDVVALNSRDYHFSKRTQARISAHLRHTPRPACPRTQMQLAAKRKGSSGRLRCR